MKSRYLSLFAALCAALSVAGCGPTIAGANSRGGTMEHVIGLNKSAAFDNANEECKQYGRVARISQYDVLSSTMNFDCVEP